MSYSTTSWSRAEWRSQRQFWGWSSTGESGECVRTDRIRMDGHQFTSIHQLFYASLVLKPGGTRGLVHSHVSFWFLQQLFPSKTTGSQRHLAFSTRSWRVWSRFIGTLSKMQFQLGSLKGLVWNFRGKREPPQNPRVNPHFALLKLQYVMGVTVYQYTPFSDAPKCARLKILCTLKIDHNKTNPWQKL